MQISYHTKYIFFCCSEEQNKATPFFITIILFYLISMFFALFTVFMNKLEQYSYEFSIFTQSLSCNAYPPLFHKLNMPYLSHYTWKKL